MVASGYVVERPIFLVLFSIHAFLYALQSWLGFISPKKENFGTVKWTSQRFGVLASLLCIVTSIDEAETLGIYGTRDRTDYWATYNATVLLIGMGASAAYSVMLSHAIILHEPTPAWFRIGWMFFLAESFLVGNVVCLYAVITGTKPEKGAFMIGICLVFIYFVVSVTYAVRLLVLRLEAASGSVSKHYEKSGGGPIRAISTLKRFRLYVCLLAGLAAIVTCYNAITSWTSPTDNDPESYSLTAPVLQFLQFLGLCLMLWLSWTRPPWACCQPKGPAQADAKPTAVGSSHSHSTPKNLKSGLTIDIMRANSGNIPMSMVATTPTAGGGTAGNLSASNARSSRAGSTSGSAMPINIRYNTNTNTTGAGLGNSSPVSTSPEYVEHQIAVAATILEADENASASMNDRSRQQQQQQQHADSEEKARGNAHYTTLTFTEVEPEASRFDPVSRVEVKIHPTGSAAAAAASPSAFVTDESQTETQNRRGSYIESVSVAPSQPVQMHVRH